MMAFVVGMLRFFVAIGIALFVIAGGFVGWFYDAVPAMLGGMPGGAPALPEAASPVMRGLGALAGTVGGLILAVFTFGLLALLLDIHSRLGTVCEALAEGGGAGRRAAAVGGKPLDYQR